MLASILLAATLLAFGDSPFPKHIESVQYPLIARLSHTQGTVIAHIVLDATGKVVNVNATGKPMLVDAVKKWLKTWTFEAGRGNAADITIDFKLIGPPRYYDETLITYDLPDKVTVVTQPPECDHCPNNKR